VKRRKSGKAGRKPASQLLKLIKSATEPPPTPEQYAEMMRSFFASLHQFADQLAASLDWPGRQWLLESIKGIKPTPPPAANSVRRRQSRQAVRSVLPKLYPDGVPDHASTKTVRQQVIVELGYDVSWHTVHRALGRE